MRAAHETPRPGKVVASHFVLRTRTDELDGESHHHRAAQLLYLVRGDLTFEASGAWWIVAPNSALWLPGDVEHRIRARAPLEGYNVFLDPDAARDMPAECCAVSVTPLFREIMFRLAAQADERLAAVLVEELGRASVDAHRLPSPTDPRLQKLVAMIAAHPADVANVKTWAKRIGVGERTLNRLMVQETGLSFGRWRQQLHIILAIQSLLRGESVQNVASDLGYKSASSFVTMFKKALGTSPAKYIKSR
ncbi:MAG TPA: helix-turn-helix transcriptional regulator [Polyangiales bacterium]|jgi:AraC-like DNA-binding protein|nr:helix-turn-helix transcriptional regulator [Polyangiales bacterium]